jgi:hypothetical protein
MVIVVASVTIMPGKQLEAFAWARQADTAASRLLGRPIRHALSFGGQTGRLAWIAEYEDMAQCVQIIGKVFQDAEYQGLLPKAADLFVPGSAHEDIWIRP